MNTKPSLVAAVSAVLVLLFAGSAAAQTAANKKAVINKTRDLMSKIPAQHQKLRQQTDEHDVDRTGQRQTREDAVDISRGLIARTDTRAARIDTGRSFMDGSLLRRCLSRT